MAVYRADCCKWLIQWLGVAFVHAATASVEQSNAYSSFLRGIWRKCKDTGFGAHVQRGAAVEGGGGESVLMARPVLLVQSEVRGYVSVQAGGGGDVCFAKEGRCASKYMEGKTHRCLICVGLSCKGAVLR